MKDNTTKPSESSDNVESSEENMEMNEETEELVALNSQLDQLGAVLDVLEKKNDDIYAQLVEILKSSREARSGNQESTEEKSSAS